MKLSASDWWAVGSYLSGGGLSGVYGVFSVFFERPMVPAHVVNAAIGATISIGGLIRVVANKNGAPTQAIADDAKVYAVGTKVATPSTPSIGVNVTVPTGGSGGPIVSQT